MGSIWPDNKRIAVMMAFDLDAETLWLVRNKENRNHPVNLSKGAYGPKQGIPRILNMLDIHDIKATFFIPGWVIERHEEAAKDIHRRGHEIAFHGYLHEEEYGVSYEQENETMEKSEVIIERITGKRPVGHRAPGGVVHPFTIEMLCKRGYIYSSNWRDRDNAFFHEVNGREVPLVEFPKDSIYDDSAYFHVTNSPPIREGPQSARTMIEIWKDEFDGLIAEGNKIMSFVIHPQISGRVSRVNAISEFIGYMKTKGAWFGRSDDVARYLIAQRKFYCLA